MKTIKLLTICLIILLSACSDDNNGLEYPSKHEIEITKVLPVNKYDNETNPISENSLALFINSKSLLNEQLQKYSITPNDDMKDFDFEKNSLMIILFSSNYKSLELSHSLESLQENKKSEVVYTYTFTVCGTITNQTKYYYSGIIINKLPEEANIITVRVERESEGLKAIAWGIPPYGEISRTMSALKGHEFNS